MVLEESAWEAFDRISVRSARRCYRRPRHLELMTALQAAVGERDVYLRPEEAWWCSAVDPQFQACLEAMAAAATVVVEEDEASSVRCVAAEEMSARSFAKEFMLRNAPVLIRRGIQDWPMRKQWVDNESIDLEAMVAQLGELLVPVVQDGAASEVMTFAAFARRFREGEKGPRFYLKDWHFQLDGLGWMAPTPSFFSEDWLEGGTDYHFVYLGARGTATRLHVDVLNSYSWSANVAGAKRWRLLPPSQTPFLYDATGTKLAPDFFNEEQDLTLFPNLARARPLEVVQRAGEVIFVPSGWYHTVENIEDTLSVNCNWVNAYNALWTLPRLEPSNPTSAATLVGVGGRSGVPICSFLSRLARVLNDDAETSFSIRRAGAVAALLSEDPGCSAADAAAAGQLADRADAVLANRCLSFSSSRQLARSYRCALLAEDSIS